ncbi:hypothetical protein EUAN_08480 [Andreesenia angusta]|uniref:Uncharacterized protein n=1 Tax=Andreesenia angusta TaxID=39480 RepID=A0A1S1V981_9FIRM|nr:hypothetical protein [Andreesenia angusta]OHW63064.1 hypothetical protein EUAN_08480 [Andreesenia angusta]
MSEKRDSFVGNSRREVRDGAGSKDNSNILKLKPNKKKDSN